MFDEVAIPGGDVKSKNTFNRFSRLMLHPNAAFYGALTRAVIYFKSLMGKYLKDLYNDNETTDTSKNTFNKGPVIDLQHSRTDAETAELPQ